MIKINVTFFLKNIEFLHFLGTESHCPRERSESFEPDFLFDNVGQSEVDEDKFLEKWTPHYIFWFDVSMYKMNFVHMLKIFNQSFSQRNEIFIDYFLAFLDGEKSTIFCGDYIITIKIQDFWAGSQYKSNGNILYEFE